MKSTFYSKGFIPAFLLFVSGHAAHAQDQSPVIPSDQFKELNVQTISGTSLSDRFVDPEVVERSFKTNLLHNESYPEFTDPVKMKEIIARKNALKAANPMPKSTTRGISAVTPSVGRSFDGNGLYGTIPSDNTMAISRSGYVVSSDNSSTFYYDADGNFLEEHWYSDWLAQYSGMKFDPKLTYDPVFDRFILLIIAGGTSPRNSVLLMTSKTDDPRDGWNIHELPGDPDGAGNWFDFPQIGFSDKDIFVGGNWFNGSNMYQGSHMFQIKKSEAYSSGSVNYKLWKDLDNYGFNLVPCSYGMDGAAGEKGIYFVSNWGVGGDVINVHRVTDDLEGNPTMTQATVVVEEYEPAGDVPQNGGSLSGGDCRMQGGFYLNGMIHYVYHKDVGSGYSGIIYGRIDVSNMAHESIKITPSNKEGAYPAIASLANVKEDKTVGIGYLVSNSSMYPGSEVIVVDDNMVASSAETVATGTARVSFGGGTMRWGDYTGMCPRYGASVPTIWFGGSRGATQWQQSLYTAKMVEFSAAGNTVGIDPINEKTTTRIYPNPVTDFFIAQFNLNEKENVRIFITDIQGKLVKELHNGMIKDGMTELRFNKAALNPGTYMVNAIGEKNYNFSQKLIITE